MKTYTDYIEEASKMLTPEEQRINTEFMLALKPYDFGFKPDAKVMKLLKEKGMTDKSDLEYYAKAIENLKNLDSLLSFAKVWFRLVDKSGERKVNDLQGEIPQIINAIVNNINRY